MIDPYAEFPADMLPPPQAETATRKATEVEEALFAKIEAQKQRIADLEAQRTYYRAALSNVTDQLTTLQRAVNIIITGGENYGH